MLRSNQKGIAHVAVLLAVAVVAVIGFAGWRVFNSQNAGTPTANNTAEVSEQGVPEVSKTEDLKKAEGYLNDTNIDQQLDTSEIDSALSE